MERPTENPEMKTLVSTLNSLIEQGFKEDFKVIDAGLASVKEGKPTNPMKLK
jgi:hypothetical protein